MATNVYDSNIPVVDVDFVVVVVVSCSQFYLRCVRLIINSERRGIIGHESEVDFVVMTLYTLYETLSIDFHCSSLNLIVFCVEMRL